ncbi:MAG: S8 family serine peptidase, partial [Candidatus Promineifilaceae bacterium]
MRRAFFIFFGLVLGMSMIPLISSADIHAGLEESHEESVYLRVNNEHLPQIEALGLHPLYEDDYGSYRWFELSPNDYRRLLESAIPYFRFEKAEEIVVGGYALDAGDIAVALEPDDATGGGWSEGFRLVKLAGPTKGQWLQLLEDAGMQILQYYPHFTYLTWASADSIQSILDLAFVKGVYPLPVEYKSSPEIKKRTGSISNIDIMFFNNGDIRRTLQTIESFGGTVVQYYPSQPDKAFYNAIVELDAVAVTDIARLNTVLWLGYSSPLPVLDDEMSDQIVAGNYLGGIPFPGYQDHLSSLGYDGSGVIWSIIDTGVDYAHPDLESQIVGGYAYPTAPAGGGPGDDCAQGGHGTHVAGIVGADASAGYMDSGGFLYGLGVAPGVGLFAQNSLCGLLWPPTGGWQEHTKQAVLGGAVGGNNSWTTGEEIPHGYQASERSHDFMVRDGNFNTATTAEPFIEVFSAGNSGPDSQTLTAPKEAKNLIVVASSNNYRAGSIDAISNFSSRGPALDGRWIPTISAPGNEIASTRRLAGATQCTATIAGTNGNYSLCSGTSMAAPHASGVVAIATEWWRTFNEGADPSPAMAKALLVNGAVDMGAANIPNAAEGWGRINATNIISPAVLSSYRDQIDVFSTSGEQFQITMGVADPAYPLKVTLAWSDAPGAVGANPALVNDLNLTVENGGSTYLGNVFSGGWSTTGGDADAINNLENVYIASPSGTVVITIDAFNIAGDGIPYNGDFTDQDFALVCSNCALSPDFSLTTTPEAASICAPSPAQYEITADSIFGFSGPVTLTIQGNPFGTAADFSVNPVYPPGNSTLTITNTASASPGSYKMDIIATGSSGVHTNTLSLHLYKTPPTTPDLLSPADEALDISLVPTFSWIPSSPSDSEFMIEVASDPAFSSVVFSQSVEETTTILESPLESLNTYFWRV